MKKIIPTAECRFCGQMIQLDGDCELTQPQAEEKATMTCRCPEAVEYQKEKNRKEKALKNVSTLFGEDATPEKRTSKGITDIIRRIMNCLTDDLKCYQRRLEGHMEYCHRNLWCQEAAGVKTDTEERE